LQWQQINLIINHPAQASENWR